MKQYRCNLKGLELKKQHVCFVGPTSVGKSTLYNKILGLQLETGLGSTTKDAKIVKETPKMAFWDIPGMNKDFGFYQPAHLGFFQRMNKVLILFDRDIDDIQFILALFAKLNVRRALVRTKCD